MNERIKELKERARDFYLKNENWNLTSYELHQAIELKFAELIIQECVTVLERLQDDTDRQNWPTPYDCVEAIKEHFGIEGEK